MVYNYCWSSALEGSWIHFNWKINAARGLSRADGSSGSLGVNSGHWISILHWVHWKAWKWNTLAVGPFIMHSSRFMQKTRLYYQFVVSSTYVNGGLKCTKAITSKHAIFLREVLPYGSFVNTGYISIRESFAS